MIKVLLPLPRDVIVAFSGGVDSAAIVDFLSNNHSVSCAFFNHGTSASAKAHEFVTKFCLDRNIPLNVGYIKNTEKPKHKSWEEHWRDERYDWLDSLGENVVTAHHLNDCVEAWIFSAMHGMPKLIPFSRKKVLRPFLSTPKSEFISWCERKNVPWIEDESNQDTKYMRNYIRKHVVPHAMHINPGLDTYLKKMIETRAK